MKRRRIFLALALVLAVAVVFIAWPRGPKEPVYEGRKLSEWIAEASQMPTHDPDGRWNTHEIRKAQKAVEFIGTNALPWLMCEFSRPHSKWRAKLADRLNWRWASRLDLWQDRNRLITTSRGLRLLGSNAAPAYPALNKLFGDPTLGNSAAWAMSGGGELALPWLQAAIASTNIWIVNASLAGLGELATRMESVIPDVARLARHNDTHIRNNALFHLRRIDSRPDLTVPVFVEAAGDTNLWIRTESSNYLNQLSASFSSALPGLQRLMTSPHPDIARAVSNAVLKIDPSVLAPR